MRTRPLASFSFLLLPVVFSVACGGATTSEPPIGSKVGPIVGACRFPELADGAKAAAIVDASVLPSTLATSKVPMTALALASDGVFFTESDGTSGAVRKVTRDGANLTTIADQQMDPTSIAVVGSRAFWTTPLMVEAYPISAPALKGTSLNVYPLENYGGPGGIVANKTSFFAECNNPSVGRTLEMFQNDLVADNGAFHASWMGAPASLGALAADDDALYSTRDGALVRRPAAENTKDVALTHQVPTPAPTILAVDDRCAYFVETASGDLLGVPKAGGDPTPIARALPGPTSLALDDDGAWLTTAGGDVLAIDKKTGAVTRHASGGAAKAIAIDATGVYWIASAPGGGSTLQRGEKVRPDSLPVGD
jgi:sugar lactone lactonase YvrE